MRRVKLLFTTIVCLLLVTATVSAQEYVVDVILQDSINAYEIVKNEGTETAGVSAFKIPNNEKVTITRLLNSSKEYGVIQKNGKDYCVGGNCLVFSDTNPDGTKDIFDGKRKGKHTAIEHFFCSSIPYVLISLLFLIAIAFVFLGMKMESLRRLSLIVVPASIMAAALMEIWAYITLGSDVFWWCDYDRYGFWGSFFRAIPYIGFIAFQLYSIKFYRKLLFGNDKGKKIALKPMFWGMGACIPATIIVAITCTIADWRGATDIASAITLLVTLGLGIYFSLKRNMRTVGRFPGLMLTLFCAVYVVGSLIAVWGLIVVLFKIILQILMAIAIFFGLMFAASAGTRYRDSSGRVYEDDGFGNLRRVN